MRSRGGVPGTGVFWAPNGLSWAFWHVVLKWVFGIRRLFSGLSRVCRVLPLVAFWVILGVLVWLWAFMSGPGSSRGDWG